jgi:hypothetical protein
MSKKGGGAYRARPASLGGVRVWKGFTSVERPVRNTSLLDFDVVEAYVKCSTLSIAIVGDTEPPPFFCDRRMFA